MNKTLIILLALSANLVAEEIPTLDKVIAIINSDAPEIQHIDLLKAVSQLIQSDQTSRINGIRITMSETKVKTITDTQFCAKHVISSSSKPQTFYYVFEIKDKKLYAVKAFELP